VPPDVALGCEPEPPRAEWNLESIRIVVDVDDWGAFAQDAARRRETVPQAFRRLLKAVDRG
jgi:hypothetical protein